MPKYKNTHTRINVIYALMMRRCYNLNSIEYPRYGGSGITVADRWYRNYKNFKEDMLSTYQDGLTLDRIDNSKGYYPENCRWATWEEQANNRTNNRLIAHDGQSMTLSMWARRLGVNRSTLSQRYYSYKWDVKRCLTTPVGKRG